MLFLLSLALVLLFTRMIIGPVKGIERMINQLGAGKSLDDAALFTGPRELRIGGQAHHLAQRAPGVAGVAAASISSSSVA